MRWYWLRALILGAMLGPASAEAEPPDVEDLRPARAIGHVVQGRHFYVWGEDARDAKQWAGELLEASGRTLAGDGWRSVAEERATQPSILTEEMEAGLATWGDVSSSSPGISPLGCVLCLLSSLDRTALVSAWATSSSESKRRALARALSAPFVAVGVRGALEQLQRDRSPEIRRLAGAAAARRGV